MASAKACSMCAAARSLASVVDTAAEMADTAIEAAAEVAAEMIAGAAIEKVSERATERAAEGVFEKITRSMMMLKIESELMTLETEMIDVDDIFGPENPSLRHVKLTL